MLPAVISLDDLRHELSMELGRAPMHAPWRRVVDACETPHEARLCRGLASAEHLPVDSVLRDPQAQQRFERLSSSGRSLIADILQRALTRAQQGYEPTGLPVSEVPGRDRSDIRAWVKRKGLEELLDRPVGESIPFRPGRIDPGLATAMHTGEHTIGEVLDPAACPNALRDRRVLHAVRGYLVYALARREARPRRQALYAAEVKGDGMRRLAESMAKLRADVAMQEPPPPVFPQGVRLWVDAERDTLSAVVPTRWGGELEVALSVFGTEDGLPEVSVSGFAQGQTMQPWLRALSEWWSDAIHDGAHPLHQSVADLANTPRWPKFLRELREAVELAAPEAREDGGKPQRVVWRVAQDGPLSIEPAVQKLSKRGWTKGSRSSVDKLLERPDLDPIDARIARGSRLPGDLAEALVGHPRVVLASDPRRGVRVREVALELEIVGDDERRLRLRAGDRPLSPEEVIALRQAPAHCAWLDEEARVLSVVRLPPEIEAIVRTTAKWTEALPPEADEALVGVLSRLPADVGLRLPDDLGGSGVAPDLTIHLALELHDSDDLEVRVRVSPLSDDRRFAPGAGPIHLVGTVAGEPRSTQRDLGAEVREAERWIHALRLDEARELERMRFSVESAEHALELIDRARESAPAVVVEWPAGGRRMRVLGRIDGLSVRGKPASDWFVLDASVTVDESQVTLAQIRRALERNERFVRLKEGDYARITEQLREQLDPLTDVTVLDGGEVKVAPEATAAVERILEGALETSDEWRAHGERVREANESTPDLPAGLQADLRDYQVEGVRWLLRLSRWASGACLADEMGLGKTLQALALLLARREEGPALVVAPTSLAYNWRDEAARFAPDLDVRIYRGPRRAKQLDELGPGVVLVTSYELLARDAALEGPRWGTLVFDEAHALKNPRTQRAKAAKALRAGFSLGMTGTPIENHLGELWSLFSTLLPGLFGPWATFKRRFADPIERDEDADRREALRALLKPFLLRRTKAQVLAELPPRTEVVHPVELSSREMARYEAERRTALAAVQADAPRKKAGESRFAVLAALTRLRRLACHPALVDDDASRRSSKLSAFLELVDELRAADRRALVFSQFTSHLALVREALERRMIDYLYLDGSTPAKQRAELVERFQQGAAPLFLISLKAGGTGLNLTAADTVIHLDPWWNPAAEDQASDRAHRIGQTAPVTVIRLISQGTIEEKVLALHGDKRELSRGLLEGAESNAKIDTDTLMTLLADGD